MLNQMSSPFNVLNSVAELLAVECDTMYGRLPDAIADIHLLKFRDVTHNHSRHIIIRFQQTVEQYMFFEPTAIKLSVRASCQQRSSHAQRTVTGRTE